MLRHWFFLVIALVCATTTASAQSPARFAIEIDLQDQTAYLVRNGRTVLSTPISSGRYGHLTETGDFKVVEKELNHFSNIYGKIVDARGRTLVSDADVDMPVPRGGKFIPAPMRYFIRFDGAIGMHAGHLPGYPASHGCVRLPEENAMTFFHAAEIGTPVPVFGRTPRRRVTNDPVGTPPRRRPWVDPRMDDRFAPPFPWR
jgi:lipoprotein-anchoring transpeptidase ErfK/SrfK